jgi:hypothetical protein
VGFLLDNILQQSAAMREMGKKPERLVCDSDSWDVLVDELVPLMPIYPLPSSKLKIYGLEVEICKEPNFEVR